MWIGRKSKNYFREPTTLAQDLMVSHSLCIRRHKRSTLICGVELIQQAGEVMDFPPSFGESQLCLIPKVENIPRPDQFRPISVTNSDYWIVMRYWAKWLMEIASGVISKEQHAMFKGRSIDEAVELVYDSFYEALAEGKDVTLLQTDFCKAYDYVNREALLHILKGLNAPPQAIYVVEKVLRESGIWLPNIGGSKRMSTKESIQSRTGVREGCLISPLLFVIVFDILLVSLKKKHNPQDLSGFMDDLGMVLQRAETINSLTPTFKKYEEATGAKLNFNKCFVLSTESYKPVGPWSEMARPNYRGDETVYLGVRLSKRLSLLKDWEKVIQKMKNVGTAIKKRGGNFRSRVRMVNTYLNSMHGILSKIQVDPEICRHFDVEIHPLSLGCLCQHQNFCSHFMLSPFRHQTSTTPPHCFQLGSSYLSSTNEE